MQTLLMAGMILSAVVSNEPVLKDVSYGKHAQQKIDLYLPANRDTSTTKLMVLIHGGSWANGDKSDFAPYIAELRKRLPHYAFANINYRLYNHNGENKFPAQENDVRSAVNWLLEKRTEYGYSSQVVLLGASAGAHLALLQGYKHQSPKAIISFFGPSDLVYLYNSPSYPAIPSLLATITGTTPAKDKATYEAYSPLYFVTPQSAPTLLLQGTADMLVPPTQTSRLAEKLSAAGVTHQVEMYKGAGHGWTGSQLTDSFDKIVNFLQANVS